VAARWCRLNASRAFRGTPDGKIVIAPKGKKALATPGPLKAAEIADQLVCLFSDTEYFQNGRLQVRLSEAIAGPDAVGAGLAEALDRAPDKLWDNQCQDRAQMVRHIGYLLLRVPPAVSERLRTRFEAVFARRVAAEGGSLEPVRPRENGSLLRALDVALHGRVGVERSAFHDDGVIDADEVLFVLDDADFVKKSVLAQPRNFLSFSSRPVVLVGEELLDFFLATLPKQSKNVHPNLVRSFSPIRSPKVAEMMRSLARGKTGKEPAKAWLAAHPDL
jgi:hypothetical protein